MQKWEERVTHLTRTSIYTEKACFFNVIFSLLTSMSTAEHHQPSLIAWYWPIGRFSSYISMLPRRHSLSSVRGTYLLYDIWATITTSNKIFAFTYGNITQQIYGSFRCLWLLPMWRCFCRFRCRPTLKHKSRPSIRQVAAWSIMVARFPWRTPFTYRLCTRTVAALIEKHNVIYVQ